MRSLALFLLYSLAGAVLGVLLALATLAPIVAIGALRATGGN